MCALRWSFLLFIVHQSVCYVSAEGNESTLEFVTALFRHGLRTVDASTIYPLDPYINLTYYPYGLGQLTSVGNEQGFVLGQFIRKKYESLIGDLYFMDNIDVLSTNVNRTKSTLSLVLAGLYPPHGNILQWNEHLNWLPIPFNYVNYDQQEFLTVPMYFCPNYAKEYEAYLNGPEGIKLQEKYADLYEYLRDNTGKNITKPLHVTSIQSCLSAEEDWGLTLPEWTRKVWPDKINNATIDALVSGVATPRLNQLSGGILVKRFIQILKAKASNTIIPPDKKIVLYSAHDTNVVYLLAALNSYTPHIVPHTACVYLELHKISEKYYVKVLYDDHTQKEPEELTVPGCEKLCLLEKFEQILAPNLPDRDNPCGDDVSVFADETFQRDYYLGKLNYQSVIRRYVNWASDVRAMSPHAVIPGTTYASDTSPDYGAIYYQAMDKMPQRAPKKVKSHYNHIQKDAPNTSSSGV